MPEQTLPACRYLRFCLLHEHSLFVPELSTT